MNKWSAALQLLVCLLFSSYVSAQPIAGAGDVIIVGGNWSSSTHSIHVRINSTRVPGKPLGVFGTASSTPSSSGNSFVNTMNGKFGAGSAIYLDVTTTNGMADDQAMADLTRTCGGYFFVGGDQSRVTSALYRSNGSNTLVLDALMEVYLAGGCVSGSSAGAAVMADPMITGGSSSGALNNGFQYGSGSGVTLGRGIGFFPGAQFDQHHWVRGRLGRLIVATEGSVFTRGYGIDEDTALAINHGTGWGDVLGSTGIFIVDVSQMQKGADKTRWGIRLHVLQTGDRVHMVTGEMQSTKPLINVPQYPAGAITSTNVWGDSVAYQLVTRLVDTEGATLARGQDPNFDILFRPTPTTEARRAGNAYFVTNIEIGVFPRGGNFSTPPLDTPASHGIVLE